MTLAPTKRVEIDSALLARLRARHPGTEDRALIEALARVNLGFDALRAAQRRNALGEREASDAALAAIRELRAPTG